MKKIIALILVAILCFSVLTSCDMINNLIGGGEQGGDETPAATLDQAVEYLHSIYKDKNSSTPRDFDVFAQVRVSGVIFPIEWTCDNDAIVIRESTKAGMYTVDLPDSTDVDLTYTLTATISDANGNKQTKSYTFVMPVSNNTGITSTPVEGVAYKLYMYQTKLQQRFFALTTTQNNENKFINTTNDAKGGADFYVEQVDGGVKIYTTIDGVKTYVYAHTTTAEDGKVSKYVGYSAENSTVFNYVAETNSWQTTIEGTKYVFGTYGDYKTMCISEATYINKDNTGVSQFVVEFMTSEYAETLAPDEEVKVEEPANGSTLSIAEALELGMKVVSYSTNKFYVTGTVTKITNSTYGNLYIADDKGNEILVYGTYNADGSIRFDAMENQPKVGDTITVYGVVGNYNSAAQMKNAWITAINGEELGGNTPNPDAPSTELGIVTNPEVGVAYRFGLFHGNENATVFFNGQNYNNYAWYFAYDANGVDVYLETVEGVDGAYRLFFYNGDAKTYMVAFPRDGDTTKGTLKFDTVVPDTYYTFNAEYNTLIYTSVTGEQFYLGSSGTYKSISCSAISYITNADSYISHLYAAGATGEEAPHEHDFVNGKCACGETDPDYVAPEVPEDGVYTIPQVLASAEGTAVVVKGTVCEIYQAWSDQYNNISFYISDDAGNRLLVFRTGTKVSIGDQVTVTGTATLYNEVVQIAQGGTTVIDVAHTCSDFNAADCLNAATCKVCGKANGEALGHNYVDGACSVCGAAQVSGTITASKTIAELITELGWTSSTTKQTFTLDDNVTVKVNGGSNTGKAYNGDHIRVYATDTPAGTLTISVPDGYELVSVKVTTQTGTYAFLCIDGSDADISNTTAAISGTSVVLNSVKNGSDGKQVRVMAIEVVYKAV